MLEAAVLEVWKAEHFCRPQPCNGFLIFEELNLASLEKYMFEWFGLSSFILFYRFYWFMVILFGYSNSVLDIAKLFIHYTFSKTSFNLSLTIF